MDWDTVMGPVFVLLGAGLVFFTYPHFVMLLAGIVIALLGLGLMLRARQV